MLEEWFSLTETIKIEGINTFFHCFLEALPAEDQKIVWNMKEHFFQAEILEGLKGL